MDTNRRELADSFTSILGFALIPLYPSTRIFQFRGCGTNHFLLLTDHYGGGFAILAARTNESNRNLIYAV